jgi:hypothetical protein
MADVSSWLPNLLGPVDIEVDGVATEVPRRATINLIGATVEDDSVNERTDITLGSASAPTGTGFPHITAGVQDAAAKLVENADVHASAAIAASKVVQATGTGIPHVVGGVLSAASSLIVNADVDAAAAIAASKVVQATGTGIPHVVAGALSAASSLIVNADVDAAAAVAVSKLAPGTNTHVLTTTGGVAVWAAPAGGGASDGTAGQVQTSDGAGGFTASTVLGGAGFLSFGASPSAAGYLRLDGDASASWITFQDGATDYNIYKRQGSALVEGDVSWTIQHDSYNNVFVCNSAGVHIHYVGAVEAIYINSTAIQVGKPIIGNTTATSPHGVHGGFTFIFLADADYTLTAAQYAMDFCQFETGAWTASHKAIFPHPATQAAGYYKTIFNNTLYGITISTGTGLEVLHAGGLPPTRYWFDNAGVRVCA